MRYTARYNPKNWKRQFSLLKMFLTSRFGVEAVMGALVQAREINFSMKGVNKLEKHVLKSLLAGGKSADDVFKLLKLGELESIEFFDEQVEILENFIKLFNKKKSQRVGLFTVMKSGFGNEAKLAWAIGRATGYEYRSKKALVLETILLEEWRTMNLMPEGVMRRLAMTENVQDMTGPKLQVFVKYLAMFMGKDAAHEVSVLEMFTALFEAVVSAVKKARTVDLPNAYVNELEPQLLETWLAAGKSVDDVFKVLKVGESDSINFFDQQVRLLEKYIKIYNKKKVLRVDLLTVMTSGFGSEDKLVSMLAQETCYLRNGNLRICRQIMSRAGHERPKR
uniref:RxLR effector candidate protein n=1 Tax=Hyaloperonospora arabidopsidis (strain Emoy2) TaxID=559515 RepID=M4BPM8_HYAAE|nr:RxLR effector candidate protein [Hyaloperonospora arabidopsidis Emoy2]